MRRWIVSWLLWHANQDPGGLDRYQFYSIKQQVCRRYGHWEGYDEQHLVKACWGSARTWRPATGTHDHTRCEKCAGTGIYEEVWVLLRRWRVGKYLFHEPEQSTRNRPHWKVMNHIDGLIRHQTAGHFPKEAYLWLLLLLGEWRMLGHQLSCTWVTHPRGYPLLWLQRLCSWERAQVQWRQCPYCDRHYWGRASGWLICPRCRARHIMGPSGDGKEDEIPF